MAKPMQTKDVFDRLVEQRDAAEPDTAEPDAAEDESAVNNGEPDNEAAEDTSESEDAAGDAAPRQLRRRVAIILVAVVVLVALGMSAFLGWRVKQLEDTAAAGQAALEAARNYAVVLTTLDAKDIDKNYRQALDGATGEFKDQYSQGSTQLRQVLIDNKAAGKGIVIDSAVKSATKTKVEVLLFVDQSVTNAVNPSPRIDRNRVQMTMELVEGRWLASKVEII